MRKRLHILIVIIAIIVMSSIAFCEPGSQEDPLVTLSYVQKRIEQVKFYLDEKLNPAIETSNNNATQIQTLVEENKQLKEKIANLQSSGSAALDVVELKDGQTLICNAGTEIILRGGSATAIASDLGGLSDTTAGEDIQMNQKIPNNHLLIVPRSDGRGVLVPKYAIFMVRGSYEVR
ncbi:hypothetical protein [Abyssisolibacter fermentans]|uniref:hypothetical protein n=1 Tax=Abyssisolibacter fermentans TaxID=1766203 RepID=UPI00082BA598|nr:hypothetical protein [Abyssisolibacter fermentans]